MIEGVIWIVVKGMLILFVWLAYCGIRHAWDQRARSDRR